jgi:hypothetical protein
VKRPTHSGSPLEQFDEIVRPETMVGPHQVWSSSPRLMWGLGPAVLTQVDVGRSSPGLALTQIDGCSLIGPHPG